MTQIENWDGGCVTKSSEPNWKAVKISRQEMRNTQREWNYCQAVSSRMSLIKGPVQANWSIKTMAVKWILLVVLY